MSNAPDHSVQLQQSLSQARELLKDGGTTLQIERVLSPFEQMFESPHRNSQCAHFVIHNLDICEDEIVFNWRLWQYKSNCVKVRLK